MICPNCGSNMSDKRKRCERCGNDLTLYKKVYTASNYYYNNGLSRAKVRDLSGAIIALRKSLDFNKSNTNARNLLGLIYFEMGETVAALSEWVISKHFQPQDNDADEYINKVQSNPTKLDALNQAIKRYNTALGFAKQGSDDLSIIQLKKVVSLNPHFIRAYQLLALLHMKAGENDKARKYLFRASKIDVTNTKTLRYLRELEEPSSLARDPEANPEAEQGGTSSIMPLSSYREDKPNIMAFVNLVIGVLVGIAVTAFLIIPTVKKNMVTKEDNTGVVDSSYIARLEEKDNQIKTLESEKQGLEQEIKNLQSEIDNFVIPEDKSLAYQPLLEVTELYLTELEKPEGERDYIGITDALLDINDTRLEMEAATKLLSKIKESTYPTVARIHYEDGRRLYNNEKYEEAMEVLRKAMLLDPQDVDAVYFMARAYHRLGDKDNAIVYYNIVINDFPDSDRTSKAKGFLAELEN